VRNGVHFATKSTDGKLTFLRARGWEQPDSDTGTGELKNPRKVLLNEDTYLIRLFHQPERKYGEWWSTPHELQLVSNYFDAGSLSADRRKGKSLLHAALAIRHDWAALPSGGNDPAHLRRFVIISLTEPLYAYHGEGDDAPGPRYADIQKAVPIIDNTRQRDVRQGFLPKPWTYTTASVDLGSYDTYIDLLGAIAKYRRGPMYFETS